MGLCKLRMSQKKVSGNWERLNIHSRPQSLLRSDRSNREKWSKGGPAFSFFFYIFTFLFLSLKLFRLDRADLFSFRPKSPEILFEWIGPSPFLLVTWLAKRRALTKVSNETVVLRCGGEYNLVLSTGLIMWMTSTGDKNARTTTIWR